jgi:flagellar protein FlaI
MSIPPSPKSKPAASMSPPHVLAASKVTSTTPEIPPAPPGENIDALVEKINALRASSGNTGFVPPSSYTSTTGIPSASPAPRMEKQVESQSISPPEFLPTPSHDIAPRSTMPSFSTPSKVVQQLQELSKGKTDTFEQLMQEKPKTLIDEYGDTKIYRVQGESLLYYTVPVARPNVSERAIINTLKEATTRLISITPYRIRDPEQKRNVYAQQVLEILRASPELKVPSTKFDFYAQAVVSEMVGYGLIDSLIKDDKLEEIMVIGPNVPVYVFHRKYDMMLTNVEFSNDNEVQDLVNRIAREVGRRVDISSPLLDARLPDGSRVNATIPPASVSGSTLTIRKFRSDPYSIIDLIQYKTVPLNVAAFLWLCVDGLGTQPANILISGGTSSGKTTLLNVLCSFIPSHERIISIEDTSELSLPIRHWIRLEGRPPGLEGKGEITLDILTKNSLRMRPDRIIVGEVRHDEAFSLFTAMNTGHDGCLTADATIALTSGLSKIGPLVDAELSKGHSWKEGVWDVCSVQGQTINSIDHLGKIFSSPIVQARRKPFDGQVYHIKLASGSEVTCTGNHPFYGYDSALAKIEAKDLIEGQLVATPSRLERDFSAGDPTVEYWSGMLHGDGNITSRQRVREKKGKSYVCNDGSISLYTEESETIPRFVQFMKENLNDAHVRTVNPRPEKQCFEAHISGVERAKQTQVLLDMPAGSRQLTTMSNSHLLKNLRSFVAGFFDAEGYVDEANNALVFTNANEQYIDFFRHALLIDGIVTRKYESWDGVSKWYRLYVYGLDQARKFASIYPILHRAKVEKLAAVVEKDIVPNTNVDVLPCNDEIIHLLALAQKNGFSNREVARRAKVSQGLLSFIKQKARTPSRTTVKRLVSAFNTLNIDSSKLKQLADADIFWDRIVSIHSFPYSGFVYDLTVNETAESGTKPHNFVANGIIVGNSMGTIHANSAIETLARVTSPPMSVPEIMLSGLNFVIVENLFHSAQRGTFRRVMEIAEVHGVLEGKARTETIFEWDALTDVMTRTNVPVKYLERLSQLTGKTSADMQGELKKRERFLQGLVDRNVRDMKTVSQLAREFLEGS